ncbi:MAG: putative LPS assembly protein LptD [Bacteroidota bacterium]
MKLLGNIIFIITFFLLTIPGKNARAFASFSFQQTTQQTDTSSNKSKKDDLKEKIQYAAIDSTITDKKTGIVYLYGKAKIIYNDFQLDADYIRYDSKNDLIFASGMKAKNGKYIGRPIFKMGAEGSSIADSLSYNTKTGVGVVHGVYTEQQGGFFSGGQSKLQPDNEVHLRGMTFSTCNLPHPHFGIYITRGIATENQIISGPVYLKIEDIPVPLGLPFGFFPKPNKKSSGFILPTPNQDATRGFSLNGGGYYYAFNDYLDGRVTSNIYTNGSFDLTLASMYLKRYMYNGGLNFSFSSTRNGLEGTPEYKPQKNFNLSWQHSQNANARPGTTFSASVNAGTANYYSTTAANGSYDINQIAQNTMSSSIAYGKVFGDGLFNLTAALNHSQETQQKTITLTLPQVSLNMSIINPFDSKDRTGVQKWYQKITVGYSLQASNTVSTTEDLLFDKDGLKRFKNGFSHTVPVSMAFTVLNYFNFNANAGYNEKWYLQTINQRTIKLANRDSIAIDTVNGFKRAGEYNIGLNLSTKIYGRKLFNNFGRIKGISHVITPNFSFSYKPDFSASKYGYYKESQYYTDDIRPGFSKPVDGKPILDYDGRVRKYSIFEGSQYGGPSKGEQANLSFQIDNNVELKIKSKKDTTDGGIKKIPIIQGLNFSGTYNFAEPTKKKLSIINFGGRSQFTDKLGFNFSGTLNPYLVGQITTPSDLSGQAPVTSFIESDRYVWTEGKLPRLTSFSFSFDFSLNPDALKSRNKNMNELRNQTSNQARTPDQIEELNAISRDPNAFVDFNIPWNIALSYSFFYSNRLSMASTKSITNTLNFNGDFGLTPKWKIQFNSGWDFQASTFSYTSFAIYRDLHCWDLSASWVPFGTYQSYSINIKVKASILQDLKLSKRKGYYTKY